jgi:hypothetical protein
LKGKQKLLTDNLAHQSENDFSNFAVLQNGQIIKKIV